MSAMVDTNGKLYVNVPHGAMFISSGGTFLKALTAMRTFPGLEPREETEWYSWDTYHRTWSVFTSPTMALVLTEYKV